MASIQFLELRPLEAQVEELSDNITGSIRGGDRPLLSVPPYLRGARS